MQGKRTRALDSRGRPVPGLYVRDGRYIAGAKVDGRWTMRTSTPTRSPTHAASATRGSPGSAKAGSRRRPRRRSPTSSPTGRTAARLSRAHHRARAARPATDISPTSRPRRVQDITAERRRDRSSASSGSVTRRGRASRCTGCSPARSRSRSAAASSPATRSTGSRPSERPKQRNAKRGRASSTPSTLDRLVAAGTTERWRAALGLAGYAGLRLGEIRALTWGDVDLDAGTITVRRSMLPDGTPKAAEDRSREPGRAAPAGAAPAARRLEAAGAAQRPRRASSSAPRTGSPSGAEPPPRPRRREGGSRARRLGATALVALAAALVRVAARDRPRAARDDARRADRPHRRRLHPAGLRPGRARPGRDRRRRARPRRGAGVGVEPALVSLSVSLACRLLAVRVAQREAETANGADCRRRSSHVGYRSPLAMQKVVGSSPIIRF